MATPELPDSVSLADDLPALARLAVDLLTDLVPGTPARVVAALADANFDPAEAGRRLRKNAHYVRTNVDRFIRQARERLAHDRALRPILEVVLSGRPTRR